MIVDIRKFNLDTPLNELILHSETRKKWYGKIIDNYWNYLEFKTKSIKQNFDSHLFSDLITFIIDEKKILFVLDEYSIKLSQNRNSAVFLLALDDQQKLLAEFSQANFLHDFEIFCRDLNGSYYNYEFNELAQTINNFREIVLKMDEKFGFIINIG